ncbi:hypothetical protein AB1K56_08155 [Microbacterium sp. BWR-S6Y]|uniref:hypothetical protein n=1 Tax=Microbacterium sp. BWR-S6Y TaxID=3232073 RepID=UPI0035290DEC
MQPEADLNTDMWAYVRGASTYQHLVGKGERDVEVDVRLLANRLEPTVSVYLSGRRLGDVNAENTARLALKIAEVGSDSRSIRLPGRTVFLDGGRLLGVQVRLS